MLEVGMTYEFKRTVTDDVTAAKAASGAVEVFATPFMIAWMEEASLKLAQKELEEGLTTVGTEVNIKHLKGSLVGTEMKVVSTLKEIDRKKLVFDVAVYEIDGNILVGEGTHTRFIIDTVKFFEKLKNTTK
ncbi:thioesterase family protein [Fusobacterium sp.]|uniref:thioesterase family protein n=1 Tax=Fusobacterium sp. TaxID=68766 RepID=UPI0025BA5536|nr:thioesterase family protein [Fusobacterium sp.]MCI7223485.1 thioesterase family protein [Fusobacterium sp.]